MKERLQKILAHAGVASRRAAEALITAGKVRVNGRVVSELGATADARRDRIEVDGRRVVAQKPVYFILHKPRGVVSTLSDPEGRPNLGEVIAQMGVRAYPIGRLDFHTSGALVLTNDGELTDALLHPRREVPKIYVAKVRGQLEIETLDTLRRGVVLDDGEKTKRAEVFVLREEDRNTWLQITLFEGRNRQIHRMGEAVGHPVLRLARTSFAGITTDGLRPGQWRELSEEELEKLKKNYLTPYRRARDTSGGHAGPTELPELDSDDDEGETEAPKSAPRRPSNRAGGERSSDRASTPAGSGRPQARPSGRAGSPSGHGSSGHSASGHGSSGRAQGRDSSGPSGSSRESGRDQRAPGGRSSGPGAAGRPPSRGGKPPARGGRRPGRGDSDDS